VNRSPAAGKRWRADSENRPQGRAVAVLAAALVGILGGMTVLSTGPSPAAGAATPKPMYYLALGDSLAAGTGASTTANRYVNVLYQHEVSRFPTLQLDNIACGGATTTSMINGPGCSYATGTQLGDAEAFLRAHPKEVALVTVDIGANNVDGCQNGSTISASCVQSGLTHISTELPEILNGLESAYPGVAIYGMNYYDPFLGEWITGSTGQSVAQQSEAEVQVLNALLAQLYSAGAATTADPATLFQTTDFALTGSYLGATEPQNVADICNWTLFCSGGGNIHANDTGHALVAQSFAQVVDAVAVSTAALPNATVKQPYAGRLGALGGHPRYHWSLTSGSLPSGMHLKADGSFGGRPKAVGTYSFTVRVVDTKLKISAPPATHQASSAQSITVQS
jgi:lysophospholipase L1-like esterase